jgi:sugar/nucleoside kinase (ribokinase family)
MTRDDIIRLAREAGVPMEYSFNNGATVWDLHPSLERFAARVAAAEREECAKLCDERERANLYGFKECAAAIRARGESK